MSRAAAFSYSPLLPIGDDLTEYRLVTDEGVDVVQRARAAGASSPSSRRC